YKVGQFTTFSDLAPAVTVNLSETYFICPGNFSATLLPSKLTFFDRDRLRFYNHRWNRNLFHYNPQPCSFTYPLILARLTPELLEKSISAIPVSSG
ncbi:hypothetical protein X801_00510, partial [Opisthorchis viverrini]